ncbi:MAG: hypothetical protein A3I61_10885 [Acidobacteria bacterium RIFCSPLOWO2_02_FULL_68_18]|nr:MAG: hypothetical protein A3I61_10885 [Acidobacteria bacterium RIFCSPLOWO2_02_FULL_68_18]OFW48750.1 MAG: hypothetical protein A3G77_14715 [Acidobacteria bacterium RIFCSPLOWO2_12_FULL_68_19]
MTVTVPAGAPAGLLTVTGKHHVQIKHLFAASDSGYLVWSDSPTTCGADDTERSHFRVADIDFATTYEKTVFTHRAFPASGGATVTLYLNSVMTSGHATPVGMVDQVGDDYIIVEFHVSPPPPPPPPGE